MLEGFSVMPIFVLLYHLKIFNQNFLSFGWLYNYLLFNVDKSLELNFIVGFTKHACSFFRVQTIFVFYKVFVLNEFSNASECDEKMILTKINKT